MRGGLDQSAAPHQALWSPSLASLKGTVLSLPSPSTLNFGANEKYKEDVLEDLQLDLPCCTAPGTAPGMVQCA